MGFSKYYFYALSLFIIATNSFVYEMMSITDDPSWPENFTQHPESIITLLFSDCTIAITVLSALFSSFLHCAYPKNTFIKILATSILISTVVASSLRINFVS